MINEIREQLAHVIEALEADLYHPIGEIELEGFLAPGALPLAPGRPERYGARPGTMPGCSAALRCRRKPAASGL